VGFTNLFVNNQPSGALELGGSLTVGVGGDIGAPIVAEYGPPALSTGWSWVAETGIPVLQNSEYYLLDHPQLLLAAGDCATGLVLGPGSLPTSRAACGIIAVELDKLRTGW
jgi:hypothetical protein